MSNEPGPTIADVTPNSLASIGEALYGPEWKSALARDLGVSRSMPGKWEKGVKPISGKMRLAISKLMAKKRRE